MTFALLFLATLASFPALDADTSQVSDAGKACIECHSSSTPGIVEQWKSSAHAKSGVDCYSCHKANDGDPATFDHNGYKIAVIVTPHYCARCHQAEVTQFQKSHHAAAAKFIGSLATCLGKLWRADLPRTTAAANATAAR